MDIHKLIFYFSFLFCLELNSCHKRIENKYSTWGVYRGDNGSNAYSSLDQINRENVTRLKIAWIYRTGDILDAVNMECNPIVVHGILYGVSSGLKTFALNAETGKPLWVFDPFYGSKGIGVLRGVNYWEDKRHIERRIITFAGGKMISLDARTGQLIKSFGQDGIVNLNENLPQGNGWYHGNGVIETSPGVIYKNLIILGSSVGEEYGSAPGHIRAYDVRTGKLKWIFRTIPLPGEVGYNTWPKGWNTEIGGVNDWGGLSLDAKKGIIFIATGSPSPQFYGADRVGKDLFANSVIALNASTGKLIWYYQTTHHDIWDYDLPAAPNVVTIKRDGKTIDAVAQITKTGFIFLLDEKTGQPLFPIRERPVPKSTISGEQNWPTQPMPELPPPLADQKFDTSLITDLSPEAHGYVLNEIKNYSWGNIYLPQSTKGIIEMPGTRGGTEWSGACVDMRTGVLYVGVNNIPVLMQLKELEENQDDKLAKLPMSKAGEILYQENCATCHGADRKGNGVFPSLLNIDKELKPSDIKRQMESPNGQMPSFKALPKEDKEAIITFLCNLKDIGVYQFNNSISGVPKNKSTQKRYVNKGYPLLEDQNGYPGIKPPWGTLNAVDLNSGKLLWKIPLGGIPSLEAEGHPNTGSQLLGGGIVTAGGLIFIGASKDAKLRAIDENTGKVLWEYQLPAGGYATPATYEIDGTQYVVIAAGGGGRQQTTPGDYYIAFALPSIYRK